MIIGIDIDDTITKTSLVSNKYLKLFDDNYKDYHDLPHDKYIEFIKLYMEKIITNNIIKEGAREAISTLKENGCKIIIITARNNLYCSNNIELTKKFLKDNHIYYDKIIFDELNLENKGIQANEERIDIFIDDKEEVLDKIANYNIKCIRITDDKKSKYTAFNNWKDIVEYIKKGW